MNDKKKSKVTGIIMIIIGSITMIFTLPHCIYHTMQWLMGFPFWVIFPMGSFLAGAGVLLMMAKHINSAKQAHEASNTYYPKRG